MHHTMSIMQGRYEVIVIGGGHAGTEAAWAASSVLGTGGRVALITMDPSRIGQMSCNPAIGGLAKGQMVREIDALGGLMGRAIDATGIMFRMLNTSKGPAVRGPRAQADKYAYAVEIQRLVSGRESLDVLAGVVEDLVLEGGRCVGVRLAPGAGLVHHDQAAVDEYLEGQQVPRPLYPSEPPHEARHEDSLVLGAGTVILTTGTFMQGLMHTGEDRTEGGRVGESAVGSISPALVSHGFELGRLKTGTPPRVDGTTVDWTCLEQQVGDTDPVPFSEQSPGCLPGKRFPVLPQTRCHITATTPRIHEIIRDNMHRSPLHTGQIDAPGPRYCPSIEDKVLRFGDRPSHHVFLEPESLYTSEIYCNGISTSLPVDVQEAIVRGMDGCRNARIIRWGYAVEYDMVWPHQIDATCRTKPVPCLYLAGQINCTTGYEEAGGQGVVAGLNAAREVIGLEPVRVGRDQAYIGVMMDDLVTKTPREPYRMFTSRAEHRLALRADNAGTRLTPLGMEWGLVGSRQAVVHARRMEALDHIRHCLDMRAPCGKRLRDLARQPQTTLDELQSMIRDLVGGASLDPILLEQAVTEERYAGYLVRQRAQVRRQEKADHHRIPDWLEPREGTGLRAEAGEILSRFRPATFGQAGRLAGVNPADLTLLSVAIARGQAEHHRVS